MRFGWVDISAIIIGAIWGAVWMIIVGICLMMISGSVIQPAVGFAALTGGVISNAVLHQSTGQISKMMRVVSLTLATSFFILIVQFQPFGGHKSVTWPVLISGVAVWAMLTAISQIMVLDGYSSGTVSRYRMELLLIRVMKGLAFVLFTVVVALPFYVMVMTSLKSQQSLLANPLDFSIDFTQGAASLFRSYVELFTQYHFGSFLLNSALVSVATVLITLFFAVPGAYAVARLRFPGQAFLSRSILLIYMVPAIVLVIPLYAVFSQLGLRNTLTGLLLVYPATTIPVALYMLQGYFRGLPSELEEAGLMDGLSRVGVIAKITMPLSLPALASVALYVFMIAWNEFLFAFIFLDDLDIFTLSRGVVSLNSSEVPRQHLMAGAVSATVPVLAIFLWFERYLVAGLTAGSVKG